MTDNAQLREWQTTMARLVQALEWTWKAIQSRNPDVPDVVITVASGGLRQKRGHFSKDRWEVTDQGAKPEVLIGAEGLDRTATEVFGTLVHEAAHGLAYTRKSRETSRRGHYHNKRFAELAIELGLNVEYDDRPHGAGWSVTSVPIATVAEYTAVLHDLTTALQLWRRPVKAPPKGSRNYIACVCDCGTRVRMPKSNLRGKAKDTIMCTVCGQPFRPDDELNWEE
jgi:hypothetical protein